MAYDGCLHLAGDVAPRPKPSLEAKAMSLLVAKAMLGTAVRSVKLGMVVRVSEVLTPQAVKLGLAVAANHLGRAAPLARGVTVFNSPRGWSADQVRQPMQRTLAPHARTRKKLTILPQA